MAPPRFLRTVLGSVALGVPFLLSAHAASRLIEPLSRSSANVLLRLTAPLTAPASEPQVLEPNPEPAEAETEPAEPQLTSKPGAVKRPKVAAPSVPAALFVSASTVLELSQSAARPRGNFVAQTPQHPAGLRLSGVGALGIGVQDGDILTEALGITPRAPGQVIGAIIEARAAHARALSGTLWRRGQSFRITVEQPYLRGD